MLGEIFEGSEGDAFGSGGGVRTAIEHHEVSSGQHYTWRRQAHPPGNWRAKASKTDEAAANGRQRV